MDNFITSDLHLGHANIIRYCKRPWLKSDDLDEKGAWKFPYLATKRVSEMNTALIANWNSRVKDGDTIFHVGDFCFKNSPGGKEGEGDTNKSKHYIDQLNGDIIFIKGNHDKNNSVKTIIQNLVMQWGPHLIFVVHRPQDCNFDYEINFVGHVHEKWKFNRIFTPDSSRTKNGKPYIDLVNVGVDVWGFMPRTVEEVYNGYRFWKKSASEDPSLYAPQQEDVEY